MPDIFADAAACLQLLATHTPAGRRRLLSVLTAALDLGDEHAPVIVFGTPHPVPHYDGGDTCPLVMVPAPEPVPAAPLARSPKGERPAERRQQPSKGDGMRTRGDRTKDLVLSVLQTSPGGLTPKQVQEATGLPRATAQYWLLRLKREGRIEKTGTGHAAVYRLIDSTAATPRFEESPQSDSPPPPAPSGLRPSERRAVPLILTALEHAPDGLSFAAIRRETEVPQATLSIVTRRLLQTGQIRTSGAKGTRTARWHLARGSQP